MPNHVSDVVIIGGGILGASTAYQLANTGLDVVVFERGAPNREGSGTTAGNLHIQAAHTRRPGQVTPLDNIRMLPLQRAASALWSTLEAELEADLEVRRHGGFMIAETDAEVRELHEKRIHEDACGIPGEVLDGDAVRAELPLLSSSVVAASWCPWDGYANPLKVTPAWMGAAVRRGARIQAFCPVTAIKRRGQTWVVNTPRGSWATKAVVILSGPWISEVAEMAGITVAMAPVAIQMHITERLPPLLIHLVQHIGQGMSVKQVGSGQILIGGGWPAANLNLEGRSRASIESLVGNLRQCAQVLPFIRDLRLLRMWAGPLAATPDELPVIGAVPGVPGLFIAGGTYAFTLAPLWSQVLRDLVIGQPPQVDLAGIGVDRLILRAGTAEADVSGGTTRAVRQGAARTDQR